MSRSPSSVITCRALAVINASDKIRSIAATVLWCRRSADWHRGSRSCSARYVFNCRATTPSTTLGKNDRLDTGRKLLSAVSRPCFFGSGEYMACFWLSGSRPWLREALTIDVTYGARRSTHSRSRNVGHGSKETGFHQRRYDDSACSA